MVSDCVVASGANGMLISEGGTEVSIAVNMVVPALGAVLALARGRALDSSGSI